MIIPNHEYIHSMLRNNLHVCNIFEIDDQFASMNELCHVNFSFVAELYQNPAKPLSAAGIGDEAAALITKIIGASALTESETRNVLSIIRAAFERADRFPRAARNLSATLLLLQGVSNATGQEDLKQQIAETIAYVQRQVSAGTTASLPIM